MEVTYDNYFSEDKTSILNDESITLEDESTGQIIGICLIFIRNNRTKIELSHILINEEYRGKGYGNILMKKSIDYCKSIGISNIFLYVKKDNHVALNLYKKHGFVIEYETKFLDSQELDHYKMNYVE